uniref:Exonuclease 3'-5' domain containing 1 n=2 Tax=Nothobranchius rachovii TaxID=451742 RepID=A0A1A8QWI3_9TELE
MVVDDVEFMTLLKGKRIKLTLKGGSCFDGIVQRINPNKTLVLADVRISDGRRISGTKLFFGREISNVEVADETRFDTGNIDLVESEEKLINVEKFQPYRKTFPFDDDDEDKFINFEVIDEYHQKFGPAVMTIKKQRVIGVGGEGVEVHKSGRLCWVQIATKNKVYLFDILLLGARAFKNGLSMILESKRILKVIHDCRALAGCLFAHFGVKLNNVFDTQVADVMCFYSETGGFLPDRVSTLQEVVSLHLKVPASGLSSLQKKSQLSQEAMEMWYKRPCSVPLLKVMVVSVIHLQPLRLVLLDTLMHDYVALVDSYLTSSHFEPHGLEHVDMESVLVLPKELRRLHEQHRKRHEQAAAHYPVTEQGLLVRFKPYSHSDSQRSSAAEDYINDSFEPAAVELSPPRTDPLVNQQRSSCVPSVGVHALCDSLDKSPSSAAVSNQEKGKSAARPPSEFHIDVAGSGRPFVKEEATLPILPSLGRGLLLQTLKECVGSLRSPNSLEVATKDANSTLTQEESPQPGGHDDDVLREKCGSGEQFLPTRQSIRSSLIQSFHSFRY